MCPPTRPARRGPWYYSSSGWSGTRARESIRSATYPVSRVQATILGIQFNGDVDATGIATLLLAAATFALAAYTRIAVRQSATELAQSQRPVLVPLTDWTGGPNTVRVESGLLFLRGAATRTSVGPGQIATLEFENIGLASTMGFAFNIEFDELSGKSWVSQGRYSRRWCRRAVTSTP